MKKSKQQFLSLFLLMLFSNLMYSQEIGEWSEWEGFPVFKEVKTKYKFNPQGEFYEVKIQCHNAFAHDLVVILQLTKNSGKKSILKFYVPETGQKAFATEILVNEKPEDIKNLQAYLRPQWELLEKL